MKKLQLSDVYKRYLKIIVFLLASGILGYVSATYVANKEVLTIVFAPVINFVLFIIYSELKKEGVVEYLRQK